MSQINCIVCGEPFEGRSDARFCSSKCRKQYSREKEHMDEPPVETPEDMLPGIDTDYFNYQLSHGCGVRFTEKRDKKCVKCNKSFKTRLRLMRWCSLECHPLIGSR